MGGLKHLNIPVPGGSPELCSTLPDWPQGCSPILLRGMGCAEPVMRVLSIAPLEAAQARREIISLCSQVSLPVLGEVTVAEFMLTSPIRATGK